MYGPRRCRLALLREDVFTWCVNTRPSDEELMKEVINKAIDEIVCEATDAAVRVWRVLVQLVHVHLVGEDVRCCGR
jgi:hypothetical protein